VALTAEPNAYGCHDPQCLDSTWDHPCPAVPAQPKSRSSSFKGQPHPVIRFFVKVRGEKGWSQQQVADGCGVNQSTVSDLENGVTQYPRLDVVAKMALGYRHRIQVHVLDEAGNVAYVWDGASWPDDEPQ
jgi:DNA-binding XRE family transcriptional regulator